MRHQLHILEAQPANRPAIECQSRLIKPDQGKNISYDAAKWSSRVKQRSAAENVIDASAAP
jgi:hypothetical protein